VVAGLLAALRLQGGPTGREVTTSHDHICRVIDLGYSTDGRLRPLSAVEIP
jgi:hypothetical protein